MWEVGETAVLPARTVFLAVLRPLSPRFPFIQLITMVQLKHHFCSSVIVLILVRLLARYKMFGQRIVFRLVPSWQHGQQALMIGH